MRAVIRELVEYVNNTEVPPWVPWRERGWERGTSLLFLIVLLHWLREQGWDGTLEAMPIRPEQDVPEEMTPAMSSLVNQTPELASVLEFADYQVRFRDSIPVPERHEICQYVADNFHGVMTASGRTPPHGHPSIGMPTSQEDTSL